MLKLCRFSLSVVGLFACFSAGGVVESQEPEFPRSLNDGWHVQLVAAEPELVTPVACRVDAEGRCLVVESHTHFPPDDYAGPKHDRIWLLDQFQDDPTGRHVTHRRQLFYEGGRATMGLAILENGWVVVASRSEVIRIRDADGDGTAEEKVSLLKLETEATYPHNGLGGLALGPDGMLYVGQGENLGSSYRLIAADGSVQSGGGEGGNIFRIDQDGGRLERVATGFWNPFGLYFDPVGRLWTVGNDPDARPPCRLIHVVPGGDYGFQFRFGRAGTHPLQAWNGELPGTLPMAAGTGEAPCAVTRVGQSLWVTSWGSHRIEQFGLEAEGASWRGRMEVVVQGGPQFRPVDMGVAPDGSVFVTDWADRSYPVHGKGRLWRLTKKKQQSPEQMWPELTRQERLARELSSHDGVPLDALMAGLEDPDPYIRQAAVQGLTKGRRLLQIDRAAVRSPNVMIGLISGWRWLELVDPPAADQALRAAMISDALQNDNADVVMAALRWMTERGDRNQLPQVYSLLERQNLTSPLFAATVASIAFLESGSASGGKRDPVREQLLYNFAADRNKPVRLRSMAIRFLPEMAARPTDEELGEWIAENNDREFGGEVVRLLAARSGESAMSQLAIIAESTSLQDQVRADALSSLSREAFRYSDLINRMALPRQTEVLRREARRLRRTDWTQEADRRPRPDDPAAWISLLGEGGDAEAGRRVFFRKTCASCHAHSSRGSSVGPDLTHIARQMTRDRLLESILSPSREVAPLYVPWQVLTHQGLMLTGMRMEESGAEGRIRLLGADGVPFDVALSDIEQLNPSSQSIMPNGLESFMSIDEFRDLVSFLLEAP